MTLVVRYSIPFPLHLLNKIMLFFSNKYVNCANYILTHAALDCEIANTQYRTMVKVSYWIFLLGCRVE